MFGILVFLSCSISLRAALAGWWGVNLFSFYNREISYSGVFRFCFFISHCHDMRVSVGKVGLLSFFIYPKEQFYKFCRVGRFFCFTVQGVMR